MQKLQINKGSHTTVRGLLVGLVCAGLGLTTTFADAYTDESWYPGSICEREFGGTSGLFYGAVQNLSYTSDLNVNCAFVKHQEESAAFDSVVYVVDRSGSENVTCTMHNSYATDGTFYSNTTSVASSGSSETQTKKLTFGGTYSPGADSILFALCTIPNRVSGSSPSAIASWKVRELY